jgi:CHAD domain-containing protein
MLERKQLEKFIARRCERIRNCLHVYCVGQDPEALHVLRVEVKKLKAVACLLNACAGKRAEPADTGRLKELYQHAALVRTAQINFKLLEDYQLQHEAFAQQQKAILATEPDRFCSRVKSYREAVGTVERQLSARSSGIRKACLLAVFRTRLDELRLFFTHNFSADHLHDHRKTLKSLMFLHSLLPATVAGLLQLDLPWLDRLQNLIGRWNDTDMALHILSDNGLAGAELLSGLQARHDTLLQEVVTYASDFRATQNTALKTQNTEHKTQEP